MRSTLFDSPAALGVAPPAERLKPMMKLARTPLIVVASAFFALCNGPACAELTVKIGISATLTDIGAANGKDMVIAELTLP
jgi:hypothetical protein